MKTPVVKINKKDKNKKRIKEKEEGTIEVQSLVVSMCG
jgi:hypothetical protein